MVSFLLLFDKYFWHKLPDVYILLNINLLK